VFERFRRARGKDLPVHDVDLKRWALCEAKVEDVHDFSESYHWLLNFKKHYAICSRKVKKFVLTSGKRLINLLLKKTADEFVDKVSNSIAKYNLDVVLNADQSSFHYEMASNEHYLIWREKPHLCQLLY
jgi:hypothetical protein